MKFDKLVTLLEDFDEKFDDLYKLQEVSPEYIVDFLNSELKRLSEKRGKEKQNNPIVSQRLIKSLIDKDGNLDPIKFKNEITDYSKITIFDSEGNNPKISRSGSGSTHTISTEIPALKGIAWSERKQMFHIITTCPGAGECIKPCYARQDRYVRSHEKIMKLVIRLNLLLNHPDEYENRAYAEALLIATKQKRQRKQLRIRWNNSGDFLSDEYYQISRRVTDRLLAAGFDVRSYAYTKVAKYYGEMDITNGPPRYVMNFSNEANFVEKFQIKNWNTTKHAIIVGREVWIEYFKTAKRGGAPKKDETGLAAWKDPESGPDLLRFRIAEWARDKDKYNLDTNSSRILYTWELPPVEDKTFSYDVIVLPAGDSDEAAQRLDVRTSFLTVH